MGNAGVLTAAGQVAYPADRRFMATAQRPVARFDRDSEVVWRDKSYFKILQFDCIVHACDRIVPIWRFDQRVAAFRCIAKQATVGRLKADCRVSLLNSYVSCIGAIAPIIIFPPHGIET